jgi:two-component system, OmpR family, phosphate regulon response regulator PhoB
MPNVLIVDDELDIANLMDVSLRESGLSTSIALTGARALQIAHLEPPDMVLLDLMLPDVSGTEVCRRLKAEAKTRAVPIVMVTARSEEADRIEGFEAGADDYVSKPFSPRELVLRVKAILARRRATISDGLLEVGLLRLDIGAHRAFVAEGEVELTALEFRLLNHLMGRPGKVHTREQLLTHVWGVTSPMETRTVDTHMMRLREKLGVARTMLETVRGVGYRLLESVQNSSV